MSVRIVADISVAAMFLRKPMVVPSIPANSDSKSPNSD